jgi:hypothetical protein
MGQPLADAGDTQIHDIPVPPISIGSNEMVTESAVEPTSKA